MTSARNDLSKADEAAILWLARLDSPYLSEKDKNAFLKWLEASPEHQLAYIQAEQAWQRGEVLQRLPVASEAKRSSGILWPGLGAGLALAASIVGAIIWLPSNNRLEPLRLEFATAKGEIRTVDLRDGSQVSLNTQSSLRVVFDDDGRVVYLNSGEVFFDVSPDPERPFEVITGDGRVRVLGTEFSVDQGSTVTVLEGKVGLSEQSDGDFKPSVTLTQNQQLSIGSAAKGEPVKTLDAESALAWRNKKLVYRGEVLSRVVSDLQRYYSHQITLENEPLGNRKVVVVLKLANFEETIRSLSTALSLDAVFNDNKTEVLLKSQL